MYPLKMIPAFKNYLWGGERLASEFNKVTNLRPIAESWEISCHIDGLSIVSNGEFKGLSLAQVLSKHPEFAGQKCEYCDGLPILIKLIDAKQSLSIQVHPNDEYSKRIEGQLGKNEMWYVLDALPNASLIMGTTCILSKQELRNHILNNTLLEVANKVTVKTGDCFCIPAGMLHAIGEGVIIAEIQQSSNVTYRVYDFNRIGLDGKTRPLHIDKAIDVIDSSLKVQNSTIYSQLELHEGYSSFGLANWEYFTAKKLDINSSALLKCNNKSFQSLLVISGNLILQMDDLELSLSKGDSVFIPASENKYNLLGSGQVILVSL